MKMSREESIKKIFDMGFNGNVSSIIDYDVIDYDDGTQLGIEACEQIYEQYSDFCYNFNGFVEEFREDENALAKFKKRYPQYSDLVQLDHFGNMEEFDLQDFACNAIDKYLSEQKANILKFFGEKETTPYIFKTFDSFEKDVEAAFNNAVDVQFNDDDFEVIDVDSDDCLEKKEINKALSEYYNCKVTAVHIDECHGVYICHK